jgi:hypothetical protein
VLLSAYCATGAVAIGWRGSGESLTKTSSQVCVPTNAPGNASETLKTPLLTG